MVYTPPWFQSIYITNISVVAIENSRGPAAGPKPEGMGEPTPVLSPGLQAQAQAQPCYSPAAALLQPCYRHRPRHRPKPKVYIWGRPAGLGRLGWAVLGWAVLGLELRARLVPLYRKL